MEEMELVVAALMAGATAGLSDTVAGAVKDAYAALRTAVARALSRHSGDQASADDEVEQLLRRHGQEPEVVRERLVELLRRTGADQDATVVAAATRLRDELKETGGQFRTQATTIYGNQTGFGNIQTNDFSGR